MKSAIVFSLMVDGSGSRGCRIFGRLRPVRIVRKRGVMLYQSASCGYQANFCFWERNTEPATAGFLLALPVDGGNHVQNREAELVPDKNRQPFTASLLKG